MDLVNLSEASKNIQLSSNVTDNITTFIMTMSNYQQLRMHHMLTLDICRMISEELPSDNTSVDRRALALDILNRI